MLEWFDRHPAHYWVVAWGCFTGLLWLSLGPLLAGLLGGKSAGLAGRLAPRWLFFSVLVLTFFSFRWPVFLVNEELNPDESQIIAGAITLRHDPLYWRAVDGMSHGPLDDYALMLPWLLGQTPGYSSAHLIAAGLALGAVLLAYCALACLLPEPLARAGCLPAFCFFAFSTYWDFVHYSSEHVPLFLLALGVYFLAAELRPAAERPPGSWRWLAAGITLGAVPLAKLQSAPIAAGLLLTASVLDFFSGSRSLLHRGRRLGLLLAGSALIPGGYALLLLSAGQGEQAWNSYIVQNLVYVDARKLSYLEMLRQFWQYADVGGFFAFAAGCAGFLTAGLSVIVGLRLPAFSAATGIRLPLVLVANFLLLSLVAVLAPGRQSAHYLLLLVIPAGLLVGLVFAAGWQSLRVDRAKTARIPRALLLGLFVGLLLWPQVQSRARRPHSYVGRLVACTHPPVDPVTAEILRHTQPDESLGHWGWMCRYYVLTGLRQATREAETQYQIQSSPQFDFFRTRYLTDLEKNRPPVFIDTVGAGNFVFTNRAEAHESFPALRDFIAHHYRLTADIEGTRIYVRHDRLPRP